VAAVSSSFTPSVARRRAGVRAVLRPRCWATEHTTGKRLEGLGGRRHLPVVELKRAA
jgi:hypothetical protein